MALRGKKPEAIQKRLKLLMYGAAGVGKTTAALQFPKPYLMDTERGAENAQYVKLLEAAGGLYFGTEDGSTDPKAVIDEINALISTKHPYLTLVIDPLTVIYNDLLDKGADEMGGTDFGRHKIPADRKIKHLLNRLLCLDMNVIITSHAKPLWVRGKDAKGKETAFQEGMTFDCYGRLDYLFDLVIEVQKRGKDRVGVIRKSRIENFPEGDIFPFSYEEIANRYGRDVLERSSIAVALASPEQVAEVQALLGERVNGKELAEKWLDKANAETFAEMSADAVTKCIEFLKSGAVAK